MSVTVIQLTVGFIVAGVGVICGYTIHIQLTVGFSVARVGVICSEILPSKTRNPIICCHISA